MCSSYCDYEGAAVGDPCSTSAGSFTEGEGLCIRACDIYKTIYSGGGASCTSSYKWAGGGGGYSGGGPGHNGGNGDGQYGGGGGSYYSGTLVTGTTGENSGHGEVTITKQ